ncbi:hypothetical protein EVAR_52766_1 [Eumeta japonica]|uniref:Peptidase M12B propeptide domain-containing protein n=1 Tax=Eumeta variegata TaxID=151549 RepID=A0A4C1XGE5_EUMVA|nr:hypothetical protein EVAR_52766_1 [Eumeta japonica]
MDAIGLWVSVKQGKHAKITCRNLWFLLSSLGNRRIYSHLHLDPERAEVVTPVRVSREGEFISRTLSHSHEHGHARARRSLNSKEHTVDHMLHYNITVDGRNLRLDLSRCDSLESRRMLPTGIRLVAMSAKDNAPALAAGRRRPGAATA